MAERRDLEESEELLEGEEIDTLEFWQEKQRELVTNVVDYNLKTLTDLVTDEAIDVAPKYQRRFRWDDRRQSKLIESFLMNVPVPPVFLNEDNYGEYSIIDGKQRITAIVSFLRGRLRLKGLEIFSDLNGLTFDEFPSRLKRVVETRPNIRAVIILRQSDSDLKYEVFRRLNTGGVKLNAQEIRNSVFHGTLNELIVDLSESKQFHQALGIKAKSKSSIWREMRDAEFVLRFFTFREVWGTFSSGMRRQMDAFMERNRNPDQTWLDEAKADFQVTLETVRAAFGNHAFHRWQPDKGSWRQQVLAALFDAQMFAARGRNPEEVRHHQKAFIAEVKRLFEDDEFRGAVDAATNTPAYFRKRITMMQEVFARILD